ncbi:hypothetical protein B0H11DRAFT_2214614 [Mycena galericulata]|nr:hypothetical protein B0H11DRAFT_2214614 [Mycena galericulata]
MSTKTDSPLNRFPAAPAHKEYPAAAVAGAPLPDADRTSTGLPADALSKNKQDLVTTSPRLPGSPQRSLDSRWGTVGRIIDNNRSPTFVFRHVTKRSATEACLFRIKLVWRCLAFTLLLLLLVPPLLSMLDDTISNVASVASANNTYLTTTIVACLLSIAIFRLLTPKIYTPEEGLREAQDGYAALWVDWTPIDKEDGPFAEDRDIAKTGEKIESALKEIEKQLNELKTAGTWKKLATLHWGICAAHTYNKQRASLAGSIQDYQVVALRRSHTRVVLPASVPNAV